MIGDHSQGCNYSLKEDAGYDRLATNNTYDVNDTKLCSRVVQIPRGLYMKRTGEDRGSLGVLYANFEKNSQEVPRSCFVGVAWNFFHPKGILES